MPQHAASPRGSIALSWATAKDLQGGCFIERASSTAALLDGFLVDEADAAYIPATLDQSEWRRCCTRARRSRVLPPLHRRRAARARHGVPLLNPECPRSIRFAAVQLEAALRAIGRYTGRASGGRAERLSGRLRASLDYGQVDEILSEDPHTYLAGVARQCTQIHTALYQSYIAYPIETALPA